jgi:hypothetical protein
LASPSLKLIWTPNKLLDMVAKLLHLVTKCCIASHLRICSQQHERFHQWVANSWMRCTWNFFDSTLTKWLMWWQDIDLSWVIAITSIAFQVINIVSCVPSLPFYSIC